MFSEEDLLPLSGLQHLAYCPKQWALIHLEKIWEENLYTAEGRLMHEKAHSAETNRIEEGTVLRSVCLRSFTHGLIGVSDVIECYGIPEGANPGESTRVVPIEYKRGSPKGGLCDEVQLCAQALCLEEMWQVEIACGYLFYGKTRRRLEVVFSDNLRAKTAALACEMHQLYQRRNTPKPVYQNPSQYKVWVA